MAEQRLFFISHSVKDAEIAKFVVEGLEAGGAKCWVAPRNIREGYAYDSEIVDGLTAATDLIILLSDNANASEHVAREVGLAQDQGKRVLPVRVQDVEPKGSLLYRLARLQRIDYFADPAAAMRELSEIAGQPYVAPKRKPPTAQAAAAEMDYSDGKRPLTRPEGVYSSLFLGAALGLPLGYADHHGANPSADTLAQSLGLGVLLGLILLGPLFMLSRWLVALGDRRVGIQPRRYFDLPFSIVVGLAAAFGFLSLIATENPDSGALSGSIGVFAFSTPFFGLIYFLGRTMSSRAKTPVARPFGLPPSRFERFALFGLIPLILAAFIPFAETTPDADPATADVAGEAPANYGLTPNEIAALDATPAIKTAVERVEIEAVRAGADGGDALGQALMCAAYDAGIGVTADADFARTLCARAAAQGSPLARFILSLYKYNGVGEPGKPPPPKSSLWRRKATPARSTSWARGT